MTPVATAPPNSHHGLAAHEVVLYLGSDPHAGLAEDEATARLDRFGPNELPAAHGGRALARLLRQFHHPLVYVLVAAGSVALVLGEGVDASVIGAVVLLNAVIGYVQESKAQAALDSLRALVRTDARVVRHGVERRVPSAELVPGDLVLVAAGDKVPADLRLVRATELRVDESALTGESLPVHKDEVVLPELTPVADRRNMLYSGSLVSSGVGAGIAVATGAETELGEIHRLVGTTEVLATPLTRKLSRFSAVLTVVILGLAALTFAVGLARGEPTADMLTAAVALAVGAIPEGLPAAVTITLAIGVARMSRRRAIIRRLPAVETLGSTTVACSDKTGTLTENRMTVRSLWAGGELFSVVGADDEAQVVDADGAAVDLPSRPALRWCLLAGVGCNDAVMPDSDGRGTAAGHPTELALLGAAQAAGLSPGAVRAELPRVGLVPFTSDRKIMITVHRDPGHEGWLVLAKGAGERVLELCGDQLEDDGARAPLDPQGVLAAADRLAAEGLRVLGTAMARIDASYDPTRVDERSLAGTMTFTGHQAMLDPPRAAAADAVRSCQRAGIAVKMITGDHAGTATVIARQVGLLPADGVPGEGRVVTGAQLLQTSPDQFQDVVERAAVFARVSAEQKLRLVEALQARGHVVAMTGDGVNDAPALRRADIGIAMGRGGTEVAKDAADMILLDDDFTTIEAAVEEGRGVFDNLTKFIVWTLPTNMGEGLVILLAILLGRALPILPVQILWINMTTAVALGLMLAFEPKEAGIMDRRPRDPDRPLLTTALVVRILLVSALLVAGSQWVFQWELDHGATTELARTAAMNVFVAVELFYLFSCRSLTQGSWRLGPFSNRWLLVGVSVQVCAQVAITYLPAMNSVFQTAPLGPQAWLRILAVALLASVVVGVDKRFRRSVM